MSESNIIILIAALIPTITLIIGGQYVLNIYSAKLKEKEAYIDLSKTIKLEQYKSLNELYRLFGQFMELYRKINFITVDSTEEKYNIFKEILKAESQVDSLIVKIANEFVSSNDNIEEVSCMLGNLRQSVHIWRESFGNNKKLPFNISDQDDYLRFKKSFAKTAEFMGSKISQEIEFDSKKVPTSYNIVCDAFDRKHENWKKGHFYTGG